MYRFIGPSLFVMLMVLGTGCRSEPAAVADSAATPAPLRVIIDSDANNELDDQHALAYALLSPGAFQVEGITVNRTRSGGDVDEHAREAERIVRLCDRAGDVPVLKGASGTFGDIVEDLQLADFDGKQAVDFIIDHARADDERTLTLVPIGKLTNVALAFARAPDIMDAVRVVWLGSNYPEPGEYNQENDESALAYLLDKPVQFEIALVRYGATSGTDAVRVTPEEIRGIMPGLGPRVSPSVVGRDGGLFSTFGDYSVHLFENIDLYGDPPSRALFDLAAVAIVKEGSWANPIRIAAPRLLDGEWHDRPDNERTIILWEDFDRDSIMQSFYAAMRGSG